MSSKYHSSTHPLIHSSTHPLILIRSPLKHHSSSFAYSFLPAFVHFISFHFIHSFVIFIHSFILACHDEGLELGANLLAGEKQLWRPKLCGTDGSALDEVAGLQWTSWPPADCALEDQSSFKAELLPLRVCLLQRLTPALHHPLDTVSTIFHCGFIISHRAIPAGCASLTCQHLVLGFCQTGEDEASAVAAMGFWKSSVLRRVKAHFQEHSGWGSASHFNSARL